jgi:hypothetical protein
VVARACKVISYTVSKNAVNDLLGTLHTERFRVRFRRSWTSFQSISSSKPMSGAGILRHWPLKR